MKTFVINKEFRKQISFTSQGKRQIMITFNSTDSFIKYKSMFELKNFSILSVQAHTDNYQLYKNCTSSEVHHGFYNHIVFLFEDIIMSEKEILQEIRKEKLKNIIENEN